MDPSKPLRRRDFLALSSAALEALPLSAAAAAAAHAVAREARETRRDELETEVVSLGGGLGGCAAALAVCRNGRRAVLVEPDAWIGGQLTNQAVPPDENAAIETGGSSRSYRALRELVREHYRRGGLTEAARSNARLNPGGGFVSAFCCEPRLALSALDELLAAQVAAGRLTLLTEHEWVAGEVEGDRVRSVTLRGADGARRVLRGRIFLDASEEGDVLELLGVEHVVGAEARGDHGEPSAPEEANPLDQQAITWCLAMDHVPGEDFTGSPPAGWERWGDYRPALTPPWPGPLFSLVGSHPITLEPRRYGFVPPAIGESAPRTEAPNLFAYRQVVNPEIWRDGDSMTAVTILNWPQNDAMETPLFGPGIGPAERARALREAREVSLGLLHWLRTECPRPDGGAGWPGLRLRGDVVGTEDGLARRPYIREARRLRAEFTVTEQHVSPALREADPDGKKRAASFFDTCGIGHYRIDLHPSTSGRNYVDLDCLPFEVPYGALLPLRVENLLSAGKSMGTTHLTNGAYRLHPVEWGVGEAAGIAAVLCLEEGLSPRALREPGARLEGYQARLAADGMLLRWS